MEQQNTCPICRLRLRPTHPEEEDTTAVEDLTNLPAGHRATLPGQVHPGVDPSVVVDLTAGHPAQHAPMSDMEAQYGEGTLGMAIDQPQQQIADEVVFRIGSIQRYV